MKTASTGRSTHPAGRDELGQKDRHHCTGCSGCADTALYLPARCRMDPRGSGGSDHRAGAVCPDRRGCGIYRRAIPACGTRRRLCHPDSPEKREKGRGEKGRGEAQKGEGEKRTRGTQARRGEKTAQVQFHEGRTARACQEGHQGPRKIREVHGPKIHAPLYGGGR